MRQILYPAITCLALTACATGPGADLATIDMPAGLIIHIERAGSGLPSSPFDTIVLDVEISGETIGPIDQLSTRTREVELTDRNLIEGLRVALPGIRVGERRRIEVPWRLAYGAEGRPPIPPREDLLVLVTCTSITRADDAP